MTGEQVYVFDACAIVALLDGEEGASRVEALLGGLGHRCLVHALNLCEVYYHLYRSAGPKPAGQLEAVLRDYGLLIESSLSSELWKSAGRLKAQWRRVSLADCFAVALTLQQQGTLVTSDRHELQRLEAAGVCQILFIR